MFHVVKLRPSVDLIDGCSTTQILVSLNWPLHNQWKSRDKNYFNHSKLKGRGFTKPKFRVWFTI